MSSLSAEFSYVASSLDWPELISDGCGGGPLGANFLDIALGRADDGVTGRSTRTNKPVSFNQM